MQRLGLPPDSRRYTPHVTIGRCKKCPPESIASYLSRHGEAWPGLNYLPTGSHSIQLAIRAGVALTKSNRLGC